MAKKITPIVDKRVVFCEIHCGRPSFLSFGGGEVRVYPDEEHIDSRLMLGDPTYPIIETAAEFKAKCEACGPDKYEGGEYLVRLTAAKKAFPKYRYSE